jgi:hypothetical protein
MSAVGRTQDKTIVDLLPTSGSVGEIADWTLPLDDWEDGETLRFRARFLGYATSHQPRHRDHPGKYAEPGDRCGACRWFEPRIFREVDGPRRYLLYNIGDTIVPGEEARYRHQWFLSANDVLNALIVDGNQLSLPARRVIAEAVGLDQELLEAYRQRDL